MHELIFTSGLGKILGDFFKESSGHPDNYVFARVFWGRLHFGGNEIGANRFFSRAKKHQKQTKILREYVRSLR
jgi:hypothetical protein